MLKFTLILVLCTGAFAQFPSVGKCPNLKVVQKLNVDEFVGTWFEVGRYFVFTETGGKCNKAEYSVNEDGSLKIINSQVNILTGTTSSIEGVAKMVGKKGEAKFTVTYPSQPVQIKAPLSILDTDYSSYALLYSCQEFGLFHTNSAWILTRDRIPEEDVLQKAYDVFDANDFKRKYLTKTNQEDCD